MLNGLLAEVCRSCQETLQQETEQLKRKHEQHQVNYVNVFLVGLIAALVGAAIWGGIAIFTEKNYVLVAILNGLVVGAAMGFVAKKKTTPTMVGIGLYSIASVILGNLFFYAYIIAQEYQVPLTNIDLVEYMSVAPILLMEDMSGTAFGVFCGLLGGLGGIGIIDKYGSPELIIETLH